MKVSRSSWHYKLYNFLWNAWEKAGGMGWVVDYVTERRKPRLHAQHYPNSLCAYFWFVVLSLIGVPALFLSLTFVTLLCSPFLVLVLLTIYITDKRDERRKANGTYNKYKEPGLLSQFVKAKKSKVCPVIELVD